MTVTLYKYTGKANIVNKTMPSGTGNVLTLTADYGFEGNQDSDHLFINIESSSKPEWNYAYIDSFGRYYFITSVVWLAGTLWRLELNIDVLKTFASGIAGLSGICTYSGSGDSRLYDPRLVYNQPPTKTTYATSAYLTDVSSNGGNIYIVMAVRYMEFWGPTATGFRTSNEMQYIIFSPEAYFCFKSNFLALSDQKRVAISQTICSVTLVRWLNLSGLTKVQSVSFSSPEIYATENQDIQIRADMLNVTYPGPYDVWQIRADEYYASTYVGFADNILSYADRKAQRLIDIPYVGQLNVDLDSMGYGLPAGYTGFYLCAKIGYDFGGNQYVVTPGIAASSKTTAASADYKIDDYVTFSNGYTANFVSDESYNAETETRAAQILSMVGTAVGGIASGIMTEGATIPATIASLGIGAANFALAEQRLEYQKAASMKLNGTSNGGSAFNTFITYVSGSTVKPVAMLYKKTSGSSTNATTFQTAYGKPDGAYRTLSTLTGYVQMGTVTVDGINCTEPERESIKNWLLSGVIL